MACFKSAAIAPFTPISPAKIGLRRKSYPTMTLPILSFSSERLFDRHRIAMISDAAVISKPSSRMTPLMPRSSSPRMMLLRLRSFISITRFHTT